MSKWPSWGHFRYLRFKTFPMTPRTPQCEVFWALLLSSKHSGVQEDSKSPTLEVLGFTPTLGQSGVATARTSHGQLWTHKTHHGPNSREATTFPHIVLSMPLHGSHTRMAFCPGTPKEESRNCQGWTLTTLRDYNSLLRPWIGTRSEAKL
jgi:hypothetical protein